MELTPEIQERLMGYLESVESAVKTSGDFVVEQAPLVVQELILWRRAEESAFVALGAVLLLLLIGVLATVPKTIRMMGDDSKAQDAGFVRLMVSIGIVFVLLMSSGTTLINHTGPCIKAWCAPRLVVLEEVGKLLK